MFYSKGRRGKSDEFEYHGNRYHSGRHRSTRTKLIVALSLGLVVETGLLAVFFARTGFAEKENAELVQAEKRQAEELQALRPAVQKLREEVTALAQMRLPDLQPLEFDKVITLDKHYVKNIVFSMAGKGDDKHYEYKVVTHNNTLNLIHPQIDILFFDRVGIQVGVAHIGVQKDGTPTLDMLDRGETRSFSAAIELNDNVQPEYFRLRIWKPRPAQNTGTPLPDDDIAP
ncbi:hypothetical protein [Methylomagnum sp.]